MKKIISILLLSILILTGCGDSSGDTAKKSDDNTSPSAVTAASVETSSGGVDSPGAAAKDEKTQADKTKSKGSTSQSDPVNADSESKSGSSGGSNSNSQPYGGSGGDSGSSSDSSKINCTIEIDCKTALKNYTDIADAVSNNGVILSKKNLSLNKGATVYDALKASGIRFVGSGYISSINSLSEGDCGGKSGWMFYVNGAYQNNGCKKVKLRDNDHVQWRYTCNSGSDM